MEPQVAELLRTTYLLLFAILEETAEQSEYEESRAF
jgi:hypothetical protein